MKKNINADELDIEKNTKKKKKSKKLKSEVNELLKNVSIPKGLELENIDLEKAQFLCSLPKSLGINPDNQKEITLNTGRFGPYLKCENKSARIENIEEIFINVKNNELSKRYWLLNYATC